MIDTDKPAQGDEPEFQIPPTPVAIAQAEYAYWRQFMDHEDRETAANACGAACACANIIGGLIKKTIKPKDDHPIENMAQLKRRLYASEAILLSGGLQMILDDLRAKLNEARAVGAFCGDIHDVDRLAAGDTEHGEGAGLAKAIALLDEFETRLNESLLLLPAP